MRLYLDAGGAHAVLHAPPEASASGLGVLLVPPFGWEETCSHRSLRDWAQRLCADGHAALRLELPSTGDSAGSPRDAGRLDAWTAAIAGAAVWLRTQPGVQRLAVAGLGLGGLLACRAWTTGAPVDDLVLWGAPARGRSAVRELRAFARLDAGGGDDGGELYAGGHLLSAETLADLEALDLTALPGAGRPARALLLERDGIAVDRRLREWLEGAGVAVDVAEGPGWSAMTADPHEARAPHAVFATVGEWLRADPASDVARPGAPAAHDHLELGAVRETPLEIRQELGALPAVLAEPATGASGDVCAVFLNAGAIRRTGPNRMWVEAARRWAERGVPSLRLDFEGLGDADGDATGYYERAALNVPELTAQARAALDLLEQRGLGSRFVLVGLCSGGHHAFQVALQDPRAATAVLLNAGALFWEQSIVPARDFRKLALMLRPYGWRKLLSGEYGLDRLLGVARWALRAPLRLVRRPAESPDDRIAGALDALRDAGTAVVFAFGDEEPLHRELEEARVLDQLDRWPGVTLERMAGNVHTLRPPSLQRQAHAVIDRALERELARAPRAAAAR